MHRLIVCLVVALAGCATVRTVPTRPARINHVVFFTLVDPTETDELIRDCDTLAEIPGVISYFAGTHFEMGRTNVDSDYDVGLYVGFRNSAYYRMYIDHPNHVELVTKWRPRLESLLVRDIIDEG